MANVELEHGVLSVAATGLVPPAGLAARSFIHFGARGEGDWSMGTIVLCDSRGATRAAAVVVTASGAVRAARRDSSETPLDVQSLPVSCP